MGTLNIGLSEAILLSTESIGFNLLGGLESNYNFKFNEVVISWTYPRAMKKQICGQL